MNNNKIVDKKLTNTLKRIVLKYANTSRFEKFWLFGKGNSGISCFDRTRGIFGADDSRKGKGQSWDYI